VPGASGARAGGRTPNLDQYTVDLTARARAGTIDPVLGRDLEVRQVVDILLRRRQNNPILVGEAGVGKTAVVEGFARRIAEGDVPEPLRTVTLRTLDLALLQAGAGVKGEFENRLKGLIEEVKSSAVPIILFIDEAHTMIGAGGAAGQNDAANLLKPALARGELRTLAATTWAEYKKFFEKDPALSRRFQLVKVEEPSEDQCLTMLRGVVPALEQHHRVRITDGGLDAAVRLSARYLPDRQLPDKAVSVLDTACARSRSGQQATPASVESATRLLDDLAVQRRVLEREAALGVDHAERLAEIEGGAPRRRRRSSGSRRGGRRRARWSRRSAAAGADRGGGDARRGARGRRRRPRRAAHDPRRAERGPRALQGETPLMRVEVDASIVGEVISGWTGVPVGKMLRDQLGMVLALERHLGERIIGQDHALTVISKRVRTTAAKIEDPNKPKGVFMLVGPSGVGKTETALAMADLLYGGEHNLVTINMSEFQEAHTVSTLKGSPRATWATARAACSPRRCAAAVLGGAARRGGEGAPRRARAVLPGVRQGRDGGRRGRQIDFKNSIILLTTNAGHGHDHEAHRRPETAPTHDALVARSSRARQAFKPAFLGRMVLIPYFPVRDENLKQIVRLKLGKIERRCARRTAWRCLRRRARGRGRGAVHRGGERRAQRRQHPDQLGAPRGVAPAPGRDGRGDASRRAARGRRRGGRADVRALRAGGRRAAVGGRHGGPCRRGRPRARAGAGS
jgi:type VI secretion system protein VasG